MEVISFFMAQSQILLHVLGVGASSVLIQATVLVGLAIGVIAIAYFGFYFLNTIFVPEHEPDNENEPEPEPEPLVPTRKSKSPRPAKTQKSSWRLSDQEPGKENDPEPATLATRKAKSPRPAKIKKNSAHWFSQIEIFYYMEYLNSKYPQLFIINDVSLQKKGVGVREIFYKKHRVFRIPKIGNIPSPINEEILLDFKDAAPEETMFAYALNLSGNHWVLVLIDKKKRTVEYFDTRKGYPDIYYTDNESGVNYISKDSLIEGTYTKNCSDIDTHFEKIAKMLSKVDPGKSYSFIHKLNSYIATNDDDCGPWSLYFLEQRLKNPDMDFNKLSPMPSMAAYRCEIVQNLARAEKEKSVPKEIQNSTSKTPKKNSRLSSEF